jgi:denticleless
MPIATFQALQNGIFALSFSPSDLMLATGSGAQVSEIFDVETGTVLSRLQDHMGTVKTVEFSSFNENIVVTGSRDGSIKIWDLRITGAQNSEDGQFLQSHPSVLM